MKEDKVTFRGSDKNDFSQAGLLDKVDGVGNKTQVTIFDQTCGFLSIALACR